MSFREENASEEEITIALKKLGLKRFALFTIIKYISRVDDHAT